MNPMLSSHNLLVTGGTFTQINDVRQIHPSQASLDLLTKAVSPSAFHNSGERRDPPKCFPNTRVAILKKLKDWILGLDPMTRSALIKWLHGPAGSGKSAIAQTLADWAFEEGILLASYFFSRFDSTRNHPRSLIATIAYQAGSHCAEVKKSIVEAIDADPLIFTRSLTTQIRSLIVWPLCSLITSGYFEDPKSKRLIIIDGLNKCIDRDRQIDIIRTISKALQDHHLPLIFLIASRPEHDITFCFGSGYLAEVTSRFPLDDTYKSSSDIELFLRSQFNEIKENHPFKMQLPIGWPGHQTLEKLVTNSSGQFIYAVTVTKFVRSTRHKPADRLEMVLGLRPPVGDHDLPFSDLDALYHHVFAGVQNIELVLKVLSFYLLTRDHHFVPGVNYMEHKLSLHTGDINTSFCDLHAVIDLQGGSEFRLHHASLEDFFLDKSRSKSLYIDPPNRHAEFARAMFQFFPNIVSDRDIYVCARHLDRASPREELRQDILNLDSFGVFRFRKSDGYESAYSNLELLWNSIKRSQLSDAIELCLRHTRPMDKHAAGQLKAYYSDKRLIALLSVSYIVFTDTGYAYPDIWYTMCNELFQLDERLTSIDLRRYQLSRGQKWYSQEFTTILKHHFKDKRNLEACHADGAIYFFQYIQHHLVPSFLKHQKFEHLVVYSLHLLDRLLRKAGRSERLITLARRCNFGMFSAAFPIKIARARKRIAEYLGRMDSSGRYKYLE